MAKDPCLAIYLQGTTSTTTTSILLLLLLYYCTATATATTTMFAFPGEDAQAKNFRTFFPLCKVAAEWSCLLTGNDSLLFWLPFLTSFFCLVPLLLVCLAYLCFFLCFFFCTSSPQDSLLTDSIRLEHS